MYFSRGSARWQVAQMMEPCVPAPWRWGPGLVMRRGTRTRPFFTSSTSNDRRRSSSWRQSSIALVTSCARPLPGPSAITASTRRTHCR
ncbi:MAG: hypothetical protein IPO18_01700 [bacterium]|nr:hypothetical protein [bacterium]